MTARRPPQKLSGLLFARWSCARGAVVAGLWAFILHQSSAAKAGGVYGNSGSCAQRLVFSAWAVDALTVATRHKNAPEQERHKTNAPNHFLPLVMLLFLQLLVRARLLRQSLHRGMFLVMAPFVMPFGIRKQ